MAETKCPECPKPCASWMATFSDLCTLLLTFFVLLIYLMTPKKMTVGDYNASSISFCKAHRNVIIGLLVIIGFTAGYDLLHISRSSTDDLICILLFLFCGILFFAVKWLEEHIEYIIVSEAS